MYQQLDIITTLIPSCLFLCDDSSKRWHLHPKASSSDYWLCITTASKASWNESSVPSVNIHCMQEPFCW